MNKPPTDKDIFGKAITAFYHHQDPTDIVVQAPGFEDDVIPVHYLFRSFSEMPPLEQKALSLCKGKVLDVGCGAGSHSLYLQQERNLKVTAMDISQGAIKISRLRGVRDARKEDFFHLDPEGFDTILMLMNGSGIIGKLAHLDQFFVVARDLLNPEGRILMDSSDLQYLFEKDEDGGIWIDPEEGYYGEMQYRLSYKGERSDWFSWLYIDFPSLELAASKNGFQCRMLQEGTHFDYLAELTPENQ